MVLRVIAMVAALIAWGAPLAGGAQEGTPGTGATVEQQVVEIEDGEPLALSPDGRWLAGWREADDSLEVCAYAAETLAEHRCVPFSGRSVAPDSVAWSPDGTRVAFTEEALRYADEGDVWVFDVEAGTVLDLTDDGATGSLLEVIRANPPIDVAPAWSPDGAEIVFSRSLEVSDDVDANSLYVVPADGGEPRELAVVADQRLAVYAGVRWLADGTIAYSVDYGSDSPDDGLWTITADGGGPRQLVSAAEAGVEATILVDVSATRQGLLLSPGASDRYFLVDLATGETEPVDASEADEWPHAAAFSPDGTHLLLAFPTDPYGRLAIRDLATGTDQPLFALDRPIGAADYRSGLTWATNDLAFAPSAARTGVLFRITADG